MDAFERNMVKKLRRQRRGRWTIGILLTLFFLIGGFLGFLLVNRQEITMELLGEAEITLEYGQKYEDPGAEAVLSGRFYPASDVKLELTCLGAVDDTKTGTYTLEYIAQWGLWKKSVQRTVHVVDTQPPQIILHRSRAAYTVPGFSYEEEGFAAADNYDGDLTDRVLRTEHGGKVTYYVEDSSGNQAEVIRDIVYFDPVAPELILTGGDRVAVTAGEFFEDPGYSALDNSAGDITDRVVVTGRVNMYRAGTYELRYYVEDNYANAASAVRTVEVMAVSQPAVVKPEEKVIYLTFDDGPGPYTEELLGILREYDVKATFFVCDTEYLYTLPIMAEDGHAIGIHSVTHDYHSIYASEDAYFADLFEMREIIREMTGITTTLVRFPGGSSNTVSRFNEGIMTRLALCLRDMGFQYFDWNVDSDDAGGAKTSKRVLRNVTKGIGERSYAIVLQHDIKDFSVAAVEKIILWGLENGYEFRALDATSPTCHHGINN